MEVAERMLLCQAPAVWYALVKGPLKTCTIFCEFQNVETILQIESHAPRSVSSSLPFWNTSLIGTQTCSEAPL